MRATATDAGRSTHTLLSTAWLLLFLVQVILVAGHRSLLHRRLGIVGAALAVGVVVSGPLMVIEEARRGFDLSGDLVPRGTSQPATASLGVLNLFVLFGLLIATAFWYRHPSSLVLSAPLVS